MAVLVATNDMFFIAKIEATAKIVEASVDFVKTLDELMAKLKLQPIAKVILDLGFVELNPVEAIEKIRTDPGLANVKIIGYLSHVEMGELGLDAKNAGCDIVMPKSAFSEHLHEILKV